MSVRRLWDRHHGSTWCAVWSAVVAVTLVGMAPTAGHGGEPRRDRQRGVAFDMPALVAARPVEDPEFEKTRPGRLLIELYIPVSTIVPNDDGLPEYQLWFQVLPLESDGQVVDFSPQTELATTLAGPVQLDEAKESTSRLGLNFNGALQVGKGQAVGDLSAKEKRTRRVAELPPRLLLVASGTVHRGRGVFYKFKPSSQTTLEGRRDLKLMVDVPADWQGGVWRVDAVARSVGSPAPESLGKGTFFIAAHMQADRAAFAAAEHYVAAERRLRRACRGATVGCTTERSPKWVHEVQQLIGWPHRPSTCRVRSDRVIMTVLSGGSSSIAEKLGHVDRDRVQSAADSLLAAYRHLRGDRRLAKQRSRVDTR